WHVTDTTGQIVPDGHAATFSFTPIEDGNYSVSLTIADQANPSEIYGSTSVSISVTEPGISGTPTTLASIVEGQASATVEAATFTHASGVEAPGHFSATIDWHDGQGAVAAAAVTQDGGGVYHVTGTRPVYSEEGNYAVTVVISDN